MKKIYSLLLLGGLHLFGAQTAMATDYYLKHGWDNSDGWYWQKLTPAGSDTYYCFGKFQKNDFGYNTANSDENAQWGKTVASAPAAGTFCKFTLDMTSGSPVITAEAYTTPMYNVNISSNWNVYMYAFDENGYHYNGAWPGVQNTSHTLQVPEGQNLTIIFKAGDSDGQTGNIGVGPITGDLSLSYTLSSWDGDGTYSQTKNYLRGEFNNWGQYDAFEENIIVKHFESDASPRLFKVVNGSSWYGWGTGDNYESFTSSKTKDLYSGDNNLSITTSVAGDYVFGYNEETHYLSVLFPGSYTRSASAGQWGTICLPYASTAETGATFYSIIDLREENSTNYLVLEEVEGHLVAGKPYIFQASGDISITCGTTASPATSDNGLIGGYYKRAVAEDMYVIVNEGGIGKVKKVVSGGEGVNCDAARAYIDLSAISPVASAPGRRIVEIALAPETATNISNIESNEKAIKFFENGQLFVKKNGIVYDMTGRAVK